MRKLRWLCAATVKQRRTSDCRYAKIDFTWEPSGHISVVSHFQAIADVTLSLSSSSKTDQTILAAFVLLVLLTCAQAAIVGFVTWHRITSATSLWRMFLVGIPALHPVPTAWGEHVQTKPCECIPSHGTRLYECASAVQA